MDSLLPAGLPSLVFAKLTLFVQCPSGHQLELVTVGLNWVCDQCDDHNSGKQPRWRCCWCDYDKCTTCPGTESGIRSQEKDINMFTCTM